MCHFCSFKLIRLKVRNFTLARINSVNYSQDVFSKKSPISLKKKLKTLAFTNKHVLWFYENLICLKIKIMIILRGLNVIVEVL